MEAGYLRSMVFSRLSFFLMNILRCNENRAQWGLELRCSGFHTYFLCVHAEIFLDIDERYYEQQMIKNSKNRSFAIFGLTCTDSYIFRCLSLVSVSTDFDTIFSTYIYNWQNSRKCVISVLITGSGKKNCKKWPLLPYSRFRQIVNSNF